MAIWRLLTLLSLVMLRCDLAEGGVEHVRSAALRRAQGTVLRLVGGRTEDEEPRDALSKGLQHEQLSPLNVGLHEAREQPGEAMGLMSSLDREIEEAQAKVAELGVQDDDSPLDGRRSLHDGVIESLVVDGRADAIKKVNITARINALETEKSDIEASIAGQLKELEGMGAPAAEVGNFWDTHVPVVDEEGFPRSDLPVEEVLKGRARLARLRNRYKEVMDRLQVVLGDYFASLEAPEEGEARGS